MDNKTIEYINEHLHDDIATLALKKTPDGVNRDMVLRQIEARQNLKDKVPSWANNSKLIFPSRLPIEQCSSELTARYKAELVNGDSMTDLSGGMGIDCFFMAQKFKTADYVEQNTELCKLAKHNFNVLGADINVINTRAEDYLNTCSEKDCMFIDPARRNRHGKKVVFLADCEPNIKAIIGNIMAKTPRLLIKLSPMLDISTAIKDLGDIVTEIHIIAVGNECKELLLDTRTECRDTQNYSCCNLGTNQPIVRFNANDETAARPLYAERLKEYLYEPNTAIMKSGFFKAIATRYNIEKLHINSHLYTSSVLIKDFPGRVFSVTQDMHYGKKSIRTLKNELNHANIAVRNFPLSVAELRKTMTLNDGGDDYIFATTMKDGEKTLILCRKIY